MPSPSPIVHGTDQRSPFPRTCQGPGGTSRRDLGRSPSGRFMSSTKRARRRPEGDHHRSMPHDLLPRTSALMSAAARDVCPRQRDVFLVMHEYGLQDLGGRLRNSRMRPKTTVGHSTGVSIPSGQSGTPPPRPSRLDERSRCRIDDHAMLRAPVRPRLDLPFAAGRGSDGPGPCRSRRSRGPGPGLGLEDRQGRDLGVSSATSQRTGRPGRNALPSSARRPISYAWETGRATTPSRPGQHLGRRGGGALT